MHTFGGNSASWRLRCKTVVGQERKQTMKKTYHRLVIKAPRDTDIWLSDTDGYLVQKETGNIDTSLLPGDYFAQLGIDGEKLPVRLDRDLRLHAQHVGGHIVLQEKAT
jgi:hypothetical protein